MSKHSIQTFKSSSNKWRKRLVWAALVAVLLPPLIFLRDVYRIPDYRGGNAYISTSPDAVYQGMDLVVPHETPYGGIVSFALAFSGYDSRVVMAVADAKTGKMLAYVPISENDLSNGDGGSWRCWDAKKGPCIRYKSSFRYSAIDLPPSRWHRLVAWGAEELRGLGEPDFGRVVDSRSVVFTPNE